MDISYVKKFEPIDGKWIIKNEIGSGSFGTVFEVERKDLPDMKAALKVISIPSSQSEVSRFKEENYDLDEKSVAAYFYSFVEEFEKEFLPVSKLKGHSNIVSYEDYDVKKRDDGIGWDIFIRMELLNPLSRYFQHNSPEKKDILKLGIDICKALEVSRKHNIIHKDIKPSNIFVSPNGDFKLGDFGIARALEKASSGLSKKSTYMAPEVYKGEKFGPEADIYSLGIVLYKLLNNNLEPFRSDRTYASEEQACNMRMSGAPIPKPANADDKLAQIVLKACSYDPKDRYNHPADMRESLEVLYSQFQTETVSPLHSEIKNVTPSFENSDKMFIDDKEKTVEFLYKDINQTAYTPPTPRTPPRKKKKKSAGKVIGIISLIAGVILLISFFTLAIFSLINGKKVRDIENLPEQIVMTYEQQYQLEPVLVPAVRNSQITYTVDDTQYAEIDENGLITANSLQGSTIVTIEIDDVRKTVQLSIYAPIDAEALEASYKWAKELIEIVYSDTSINQDEVAEAKSVVQESLDYIVNKGIQIDDISELDITVLAQLESESVIKAETDQLLSAYELAWDTVEANQAAAAKVKTKKTTKKTTAKTTKVRTYCSVCGSTSHTKHPLCLVCGSTSHAKHPLCPICGSTTHTKHPQ